MQSPQLRAGDQADGPRSATWLELFFDLVFVVAVAELAHNLSENVSVLEFLAFAGLFVPVWWAWIGSIFYATRFDTDDLVHRLFTAIEIFLVVVLAVNIHDGFGATSGGFALAYAAIRGLLVFKYYMAGRNVPKSEAPDDSVYAWIRSCRRRLVGVGVRAYSVSVRLMGDRPIDLFCNPNHGGGSTWRDPAPRLTSP